MKATYLILDLLVVAGPLALSFEGSVRYFQDWFRVLISTLIVGTPFIIWDSIFTDLGVWGFNSKYLLGPKIGGLPLEEVLFFFCVPFSCLFIFRIVQEKQILISQKLSRRFGIGALLICLLTAAVINIFSILSSRSCPLYTTVSGLLAAVLLLFYFNKPVMRAFWPTYVIHLAPFLLVNGVLTALPIVVYNSDHIAGPKLGTIPVEDLIYSLILILANVLVFDWLRRRPSEAGNHSKFYSRSKAVLTIGLITAATSFNPNSYATAADPSEVKGLVTLDQGRDCFFRAIDDEAAIEEGEEIFTKLINLPIGEADNADSHLQKMYLSVFKALKAKYTLWPQRKLSLINQALAEMDDIVSAYPNDLEVRLLRGAVTSNVPFFLNRSKQAATDRKILLNHLIKENYQFTPAVQSFAANFILDQSDLQQDERNSLTAILNRADRVIRAAR